jgi:oxazoline/thiazoline synthase
MTGGNPNSPALRDTAVLQFAPHLSVYLVAADTVCLYSEDRKFLLYGDLVCALAAVIADGKLTVQHIIRKLERDFAAPQIREALEQLIERGYVIVATPSTRGPVAAYWASLGLQPEAAKRNLDKRRLRIEALDVEGEEELAAALELLGARVVKRSPDITVTLVNDYFDARLPKLNQAHLADGTPWIIAQPSGIFPLVGPVFTPDDGACWRCLADRMIRNREVKAMLERAEARPFAVSPLANHTVGQSAVQLAAFEIAKALASDFLTDLNTNVISLDLLGSTIVRHHVTRRPQCPACGAPKMRNARRKPEPITLTSSGRPVMTSGGYRAVSSGDTVARFRKHVSPLTGVVSRLEPIKTELPLSTNFIAKHNFSAPAKSIYELRGGLNGSSFGKGSTAEQGEASALMEAIERYSGIYQGDEIKVAKRFTDFAPGDAIPPNHVLLYSDAQYQRAVSPTVNAGDLVLSPALFDPSAKIDWSPAWSLRDGRFRYLPTSMLYFFYQGSVAFPADSNGCAAGNTREEAIVQGFLELVERDAYAIWWYNRLRRPAVDLSRFDDPFVRELQSRLTNAGRRMWVLDVTGDLGIPTFVAITHWVEDGKEHIEFGSGSHFDARIALTRTLTELNQFLALGFIAGGREQISSLDGINPLRLEEHPYLIPADGPPVEPDLDIKFGLLGADEQVKSCVGIAERQGLDFLVLDQTRPDIETPVARVIVPGLRHFYFRFGPGRLYDVPVKLGLLDRPLTEADLNPIHPHT